MTSAIHDADWRGMRRVITTLQDELEAELASIAPAALPCVAPDPRGYFILPTREDVRQNTYDNFPVSISLHPSSPRTLDGRTRGTVETSEPGRFEVTIAIRCLDRLESDYTESWKTLIPKEREYRRALVYLGAVNNVMWSKARGPTEAQDAARIGRDILQPLYVSHRAGTNEYKRTNTDPGTWCTTTWSILQVTTIPQQA